MTNNSVINIDNESSIANSHQSKFTKDQSISTANTCEALIITEDISDNQNLDNDVEQVRKKNINVENQLEEI